MVNRPSFGCGRSGRRAEAARASAEEASAQTDGSSQHSPRSPRRLPSPWLITATDPPAPIVFGRDRTTEDRLDAKEREVAGQNSVEAY